MGTHTAHKYRKSNASARHHLSNALSIIAIMSPISSTFLLLVSLVSAQSTITVTRTRFSPSTALSTPASTALSTPASTALSTPAATSTQQTVAPSRTTVPSSSSSTTAATPVTAVSACHMHETIQYCVAGTAEYQILTTATGTTALPAQYTGCHSHGSELFCLSPSGDEVELLLEGAKEQAESTAAGESAAATGTRSCHYHNGVEHCVGGDESETAPSCEKVEREYNIPLRVGFLFVVLVTSGLGKILPKIQHFGDGLN